MEKEHPIITILRAMPSKGCSPELLKKIAVETCSVTESWYEAQMLDLIKKNKITIGQRLWFYANENEVSRD